MNISEAFPGNHNLHLCQSQEQSQLMKGVYLSLPRPHKQTLKGRLWDSCGGFLMLILAERRAVSLIFSVSGCRPKIEGNPPAG
jgi:hypothetical protein